MSDLRELLAEVEKYTKTTTVPAKQIRGPELALFAALVEDVERLQAQLAFLKTGDQQ